MSIAYHEINRDKLDDTLTDGLKRSARGDKGDDSIIATDSLLDSLRPYPLRQAEVSRDNNIYAYLATKDSLIDITDGKIVPLESFVRRSHQAVLRLTLDPQRCYVSDLDAYDDVKRAASAHRPQAELHRLATHYWSRLVPLTDYASKKPIARPEIMITYDIPAEDIALISPSNP